MKVQRAMRSVALAAGLLAAGCTTSRPPASSLVSPIASPAPASTRSPTAIPSTPRPAGTHLAASPITATDSDDGFTMTLQAMSRYREGEATTATVTLVNADFAEAPFVLSAGQPLFAFSVSEVGTSRGASFNSDGGCAAFGIWPRGEPSVYPFRFRSSYGATVEPPALRPLVEDELRLPAGAWTLRAEARLFGPECDDQETDVELNVEVTIVVEP